MVKNLQMHTNFLSLLPLSVRLENKYRLQGVPANVATNELVVDGETKPMEEVRYLLSPQDLAAVDLVPDLVHAGVVSFKIEGRLKSPEYVAAVTRVYRNGSSHRFRRCRCRVSNVTSKGY